MMVSSIIDITKKAQRESFTKAKDTGYEMVALLGNMLPFVPVGDLLTVIRDGFGSVSNVLFFRKLSGFLEVVETSELTDEQIEDFKSSLRLIPGFEQKIHEYLLNLLNCAESEDKAKIMGYIYVAAITKQIDADMMLRLCSIVNSSYLYDLYELPKYVQPSEDDSIAANNFISWGLIDNFVGGVWVTKPTYLLNEIGRILHDILEKNGWFK